MKALAIIALSLNLLALGAVNRTRFAAFCEAVVVRIENTNQRNWGMPRTTDEYLALQKAFADGQPAAVIRLHAVRVAAAAYQQSLFAAMSEAGREGGK